MAIEKKNARRRNGNAWPPKVGVLINVIDILKVLISSEDPHKELMTQLKTYQATKLVHD